MIDTNSSYFNCAVGLFTFYSSNETSERGIIFMAFSYINIIFTLDTSSVHASVNIWEFVSPFHVDYHFNQHFDDSDH